MTPTQKIAYRFFIQTVLLLLLYAAAALLGAAKFLSPDDPLANALPYQQIGGLANVLLNLAALTGLLSGGIYLAASEQADHRLRDENLLRYASWVWTALLALAFLRGLLNLGEGRHMLELGSLAWLQLAALPTLGAVILRSAPRSPTIRVWSVGLALVIISVVVGLLPPVDYLQDRLLRAFSLGLSLNIGYPLAAVALGYWLMRRFSHAHPAWLDMGVYTVAGLVMVAGALVSLSPLYALGAPEWTRTMGDVGAVLIPILYLMFAAHSYAALSERNASRTLAAHWYSLSLLLFLLGPGLLGAAGAAPGVAQWMTGTRLTDLQAALTLLASAAMTLGVVNQAAAELRGQSHRVTGLTPFWLVAFGVVGGGLALGGAGLAQLYLERIASVGYLDVQTLLTPLYSLWAFGLFLLLAGIFIYGLTLWLRKPENYVR